MFCIIYNIWLAKRICGYLGETCSFIRLYVCALCGFRSYCKYTLNKLFLSVRDENLPNSFYSKCLSAGKMVHLQAVDGLSWLLIAVLQLLSTFQDKHLLKHVYMYVFLSPCLTSLSLSLSMWMCRFRSVFYYLFLLTELTIRLSDDTHTCTKCSAAHGSIQLIAYS